MHPIKSIIFYTALFGFGHGLLTAQAQSPKEAAAPAPKISFAEPVHEFGRLLSGGVFKHEFGFTNTGDSELVISNVVPSCGCTSLSEWTKNIPPGGKGTIPLEFNSAGMLGPVNRSVAIHSNDPAQPVALVMVSGTIWQPLEVHPSMALIQMPANGGQNFSTTLRLVNQTDTPLKLETPASSVPQFSARIEEVAKGKEFHLIVDTVPPLPPGDIQGIITIATSSKETPTLSIAALAIALPPIVVSPPQIFLPATPPDFPEPYIFTISNHSEEKITVTDATCNAPGSKVVLSEKTPGKEFELAVSFPSDLTAEPGQTFLISAKTSHATKPEISIPVAFAPSPGGRPRKP